MQTKKVSKVCSAQSNHHQIVWISIFWRHYLRLRVRQNLVCRSESSSKLNVCSSCGSCQVDFRKNARRIRYNGFPKVLHLSCAQSQSCSRLSWKETSVVGALLTPLEMWQLWGKSDIWIAFPVWPVSSTVIGELRNPVSCCYWGLERWVHRRKLGFDTGAKHEASN